MDRKDTSKKLLDYSAALQELKNLAEKPADSEGELPGLQPLQEKIRDLITGYETINDLFREQESECCQLKENLHIHMTSEHVFKEVFDSSHELLGVFGEQGNIRILNPLWKKLLGWEPDKLINRSWFEIVHQADRAAAAAANKELQEEKKKIELLNRVYCSDGSWKWISWSLWSEEGSSDIFAAGRDITEKKNLMQQLHNSEKNYREIFNSAGDAFLVHNREGDLLDVNTIACEQLGYTREKIMSLNIRAIDSPADAEKIPERIRTILEEGHAEFEGVHRKNDGSDFHLWMMARKIVFNGREAIFTIARDITKRRELEKELERLARTDPLTGIANHRAFMEKLKEEFTRFSRNGTPLAIGILDLDYFKKINDRYGHDAGDEVLKQITSAVSSEIRDIDAFGRLGGEEFGILFIGTGMAEAKICAERIRSTIETYKIRTAADVLQVTVSIGLAELRSRDDTIQAVQKRADQALYDAKQQGRNRICIR